MRLPYVVLFALLATQASASSLLHRFDFENGGADSVGGPSGHRHGNPSISGGMLITDPSRNHDEAFLLPKSSIIDLGRSFSVEAWFTKRTENTDYNVVFGFGTSRAASITVVAGRRYNYGQPCSLSISYGSPKAHELILIGPYVPVGQLSQVVATYEAATRTASFYYGGVLQGSAVLGRGEGFDLPQLAVRDHFRAGVAGLNPWGDPCLNGSTSDFRLYAGVLSAKQIGALYVLGPRASNAQLFHFVPAPTVHVIGKKVRRTQRGRIRINGIATVREVPLDRVEARVGGKHFRKVMGAANWSFLVSSLHRGRNQIDIRAFDIQGNVSGAVSVIVHRS